MFAQGRKDGRQKQTITMSLRRFAKGDTKGIIEKNTFIQTRNNRVQMYGWPTLGHTDPRTNEPSD